MLAPTLLIFLTLTDLPVPAGWTAVDKTQVYDSSSLYDAINGGADLFIHYGFVELRTREVTRGQETAELSVYDMGEAINAFGILRRERGSRARSFHVGAEAWVTDVQCAARKGRFYLKARVVGGTMEPATCATLFGPILASVPAATEPAALALLPSRHQRPGSLGYTRQRFLGLPVLQRCVHADYAEDGASWRAFAMLAADWSRFDDWQPVADGAGEIKKREVPYTGWVVVAKTPAGVWGTVGSDLEIALGRARDIAGSAPQTEP